MSVEGDITGESLSPKDRVVDRLEAAGLDTKRFITVENGGKASTDHTQHEAADVTGNYGVYAGSGLVILDDDTDPSTSIPGIDDLKETFTVHTPNGGNHRYYAVENAEEVLKSAFDVYNPVADWGETRVKNQYVVGPGSENPDGDVRTTYTITNDTEIATISPQALVAALRASGYGESSDSDDTQGGESGSKESDGTPDLSDKKLLEKAQNAEYGSEFTDLWNGKIAGYNSHSEADYHLCRHLLFWTGGDKTRTKRLFKQSDLCRDKWTKRRDYRERTLEAADKAISDYYDPSKGNDSGPSHTTPPEWIQNDRDHTEKVLTPRRVAEYVGRQPGENETLADVIADLSDREKAAIVWELLKQSEEYHVRLHRGNGTLYAYENGVWKPEGQRTLRHAARQALGSSNYGTNVLRELESQAKADPVVEVEGDTFGLESGVIAVTNGLLNLETETLRDLKPEDYALTRLPVAYDPDADAEEWKEFIGQVVETSKIDAFQEYVGYTLHRGGIPINRALLLVGDGANGKSTALNTVRALLGESNTTSKAIHDFAEPNHIADLHGSIANIHADLSEGSLTAKGISKFKGLTGGDTMEGRRLYEESFEFQPTAKHLYAANTTPDVSSYVDADDSAWWRRWLVIQFPRYFPPNDRDPLLETRLTTEENLSGVLNWAIDGWQRLMEQGQFTNEDTTGATRKRWVTWGENVEEFVETCVERDPDAENLSTSDAYEIYTAWCRENGETPIGQRQFTRTLRDAPVNVGYKKRVRPGGTGQPRNGYKALGFTENAPSVDTVLSDDSDGTETDYNPGESLDRF